MSAQPYLDKARAAHATHCDKSDLCDQSPPKHPVEHATEATEAPLVANVAFVASSRKFAPGGRYRVEGSPGVLHHSAPAVFSAWAEAEGYPRAGIMTVEGETVIVADVVRLLVDGVMDVIGVAPDRGEE